MSAKYPNLRLQDLVARTARVNLRDTVRILRATAISLQTMGEKELAGGLNHILLESASMDNFAAPLHSKPDAKAIDACYKAYEDLHEEFGDPPLDTVASLRDDPYFGSKR